MSESSSHVPKCRLVDQSTINSTLKKRLINYGVGLYKHLTDDYSYLRAYFKEFLELHNPSPFPLPLPSFPLPSLSLPHTPSSL